MLPIAVLTVGGIIIMSLISWAENRLKDDNKQTIKHWDIHSPAREAFKTLAELKYDIDISDPKYNDILRKGHTKVLNMTKGIAKSVYKREEQPTVNAYEKLKGDIEGKKDVMESLYNFVDKINVPGDSTDYSLDRANELRKARNINLDRKQVKFVGAKRRTKKNKNSKKKKNSKNRRKSKNSRKKTNQRSRRR